jgi:hypothetical protein
MASYTSAQLYGAGTAGETISGSTLFMFTNPGDSSYFTLETTQDNNGTFTNRPTCAAGTWSPSTLYMGPISSPFVGSVVVQPGTSSVIFTPTSPVAGANFKFRGPGQFSMVTFNPSSSLFAAGEKGAWFDAGDRSTLFQDIAGTVPVTTVGQFVGKWLDKSGNGNHAVASANDTTRPTYQIDAEGNPNVTFTKTPATQLTTPAINLTTTAQVTVCVGLNVLDSSSAGIPLEFSPDATANNGAFLFGAPSSVADHSLYVRGTTTSIRAAINNVVDGDDIFTGLLDISQTTSGSQLIPRLNFVQITGSGITWTPNNTPTGIGTFGNHTLYIGSRNGLGTPYGGKIYQIIVRGALSTATQVYQIETFTDAKLD